MRRCLCCCLVFMFVVISLYSPIIVYANDSANPELGNVAELFIILRDSGKLFANEKGFYALADNDYEEHPAYERFLTVIDHCNAAIAAGVLEITQENDVQLTEAATLDQNALIQLRANYEETTRSITIPTYTEQENSTYSVGNPYIEIEDGGTGASHPCSGMLFDMIGICENNYNHIVSYFNSMLIVQITTGALDPYIATVAYWVNLVREDGAWDYKSSDKYGPYNKLLCTYYDGKSHHITSEYFGNFNYGYTGAFLFSLDVLHAGSYAVSGFDPADQEDWPAIDDGYYYKMG